MDTKCMFFTKHCLFYLPKNGITVYSSQKDTSVQRCPNFFEPWVKLIQIFKLNHNLASLWMNKQWKGEGYNINRLKVFICLSYDTGNSLGRVYYHSLKSGTT